MEPRLVPLQSQADERGRLVVASRPQLPFVPVRAFWLVDLIKDGMRGGHAHRQCEQFIVAIQGSMKIRTWPPNGAEKFFSVSSPAVGLYVPPMNWVELSQFEFRTKVLVLASADYDENDYIRDREEFDGSVDSVR